MKTFIGFMSFVFLPILYPIHLLKKSLNLYAKKETDEERHNRFCPIAFENGKVVPGYGAIYISSNGRMFGNEVHNRATLEFICKN